MSGTDEVNGYDVFENEVVSAPDPGPEEDDEDDD